MRLGRSIKEFSRNKKIKKVCLALSFGLALGLVHPPQSHAAFVVYDPKVYAQIGEQLKKATEQINRLKEQIELQRQNLMGLKKDFVDPIRQSIKLADDNYNKTKSSLMGIFNGLKSAEQAYKEQFKELTDIDYKTVSLSDIQSKVSHNREELEKINKDATELLMKNQEMLKASNERIQKLLDQIQHAKGAKELGQLQAHLTQEQIKATNINSEIQATMAKQQAAKAEIEKLEKDGAKAMIEKTASDFHKASEDAEKAIKKLEADKPATDPYREAAEKEGWW